MDSIIKEGDRVQVSSLTCDDPMRQQRGCFFGMRGVVTSGPHIFGNDLDAPVDEPDCLVEFEDTCAVHSERSCVFSVDQLRRIG